jgi:hypothetical protein
LQRPIRAIAYGFLIWWIWFGFIGIATLLPDDLTTAPAFASVRLLVLVLLTVFFAVDYLHRIGKGSIGEGVAVGTTWAFLMVANDIGHFVFMEPTAISTYLSSIALLYAWIPVVTALVFGRLQARSVGEA